MNSNLREWDHTVDSHSQYYACDIITCILFLLSTELSLCYKSAPLVFFMNSFILQFCICSLFCLLFQLTL